MVASLFKSIWLKAIFPAILLFAAVLRPCLLSSIYVLLALIAPVLPSIESNLPISGGIRCFTLFSIIYCAFTLVTQSTYQTVEKIIRPEEDSYREICNTTGTSWMRYIGLMRFHGGDQFESVRTILPDILVFIISFLTFFIVNTLSHRDEDLDVVGDVQQIRDGQSTASGPDTVRRGCFQLSMTLRRLSNVLIIVLAAVVGSIQPSILNSIYFVCFLFIATWWSLYKPIRHSTYNTVKNFMLGWLVVHLMLIYLYQIPVFQTLIPSWSWPARFVGLFPLFSNSCDRWWAFPLNITNNEWPALVNPLALLTFYHLLVIQLCFTKNGCRTYFDDEIEESSVHEELLSGEDHQTSEDTEQFHGIPLKKVTSKVVDRQKISQIFRNDRGSLPEDDSISEGFIVPAIFFCLQHSYALSLISIMIWALIYHSIFGLILLITGCILWIFQDTRRACFHLSPILLFYVETLLLLQYICSMDWKQDVKLDNYWQMIGIIIASNMENAFVTLLVKTLLSLPVFLLLRLSLREKFYDALSEHERSQRLRLNYGTFSTRRASGRNETNNGARDPTSIACFRWLSHQVAAGWGFIVAGALLIVATQNNPVIYSIGFFLIWSLLILYFKVSFNFFRRISYVFWLGVIIYTSLVITSLYIYQFHNFPDFWIKLTGISQEWNDDIGLINYADKGKKGSLFYRLIWPLFLFFVATLQLKFFHSQWMKMTEAMPNESVDEAPSREVTLTHKISRVVSEFLELVWRTTEVHISKIVFIIVAIFVANNVCALNVFPIILISLTLSLPNRLTGCLSIIMCAYLAVVAIFQMIYQLQHIPDFASVNIGGSCNASQSFAQWIGVKKDTDTWKLLNGFVVAMVALGIQSVVEYRQRNRRIRRGEPEDQKKLVFSEFQKRDFDQSLVNSFKFFIDYGFFKFGLEWTMILMGIDAWVRMDFLGAVMCIWLILFALNKRGFARNIWWIFVLYLAIILPIEYVLYVGLPEEICIDYPWSNIFFGNNSDVMNTNFDIWAGLSNYAVQWPPQNIVVDFFVLLLATCQLTIFRLEGDENDTIYPDEHYYLKPENPYYDFIAEQKSFVDFIKIGVFHYGHWITLIATLVAGIGGTSLFALGYIVITFWILWQGNNLYVMNADSNKFKNTLARWKTLLTYTAVTIFCKVALQVVGCVFLEDLCDLGDKPGCYLRQLFSITCVNNIIGSRGLPIFPGEIDFDKRCSVTKVEAQIGFDVVALAFLLFQMRAFHSWYFQHCMVEYRSEVLLANRGAVLKNQLIEKEMKEQNIHQQEKFDEIRRRTEVIRERYNKQQERGVIAFEPQTYGQAKRAGDYYMFEYDPSADELVEPVESFVPEPDPQATNFDKLDPGQLVYVAGSRDEAIGETLRAIEEAEKIADSEHRMSALVTTTPSATNPDEIQISVEEGPRQTESKALAAFRFIQKIICNGLDMISVQFNKMSREHRYVAFVLAKEKEKMKDSESVSLTNTTTKLTDLRNRMDITSLQLVQSERDIEKMETEAQNNFMKRSSIARLVNAIGNCIAANTDILCYFLAVLAHSMGGGLLTLPLPLMVFAWGTLSNPRPSKAFWVTMIAYTEFVVVCKFIFQFNFWPFNSPEYINQHSTEPLSWPKVLGIQRESTVGLYDVPLLFALFFHRYMLRKLGLWKDANLTETFQNNTILEDGMDGSVTMETLSTSNEPISSATMNGDSELPVSVIRAKEPTKNPIARFIEQLFHPKFRYIRDLYPIMFGLDVIAFLIVAFGYSSFGEGGSGNVIGDIQKNRIPMTLVVMLIIMTLMIVVDRGLYLRKWVYGKLAYQLLIIVFIHIWIFFVLPTITKRGALENHVAQALYIVKCMYLLVSAWQIRNGYPQLCIGNLLTHGYGLANMVFFKIFLAVPFLFELRTAIDWTWTDTSMPLFDFFNMENFYATIYNLKCARTFEANYPAPRGQPKGVIVKYFMGLPMILGIVLLVWLPLLMFALLNQIGEVQIPDRVTMTVSIEGYPPLYQIEAQGGELRHGNPSDMDRLNNVFSKRFRPNDQDSLKRSRNAVSYLKDYTPEDILFVSFRPESEVSWLISNASMEALKSQLSSKSSMRYQLYMEFSRPYDPQKKVAAKHTYLKKIDISNDVQERQKIISAINGDSGALLTIPLSFPSYTLVPNEGEVTVPDPLVDSILLDDNTLPPQPRNSSYWMDTLTLKRYAIGGNVWTTQAKHPDQFTGDVFFNSTKVTYGPNLFYVQTVAFIDRAYPSLFAKYLQGGVITMYLSLVIVIGRLLRGVFTSSPADIMISEIPNPDYMLKICLDIYLVREAKDFYLEQDLFAKLIFLFRSPATLIQWTRYKVKQD